MLHNENIQCGIIKCICGNFICTTCRGTYETVNGVHYFAVNTQHLHNVLIRSREIACATSDCSIAIGRAQRRGAFLENVVVEYNMCNVKFNLWDARFKSLVVDDRGVARIIEYDSDNYVIVV